MGNALRWFKERDIWSRIIQFAAFSVSCYLTMGMFSALVTGAAKVWIFRAFGFIYESSKLSVLRKSFSIKRHRASTRVFALILMSVSVAGAVLSAVKDTMAAEAGSITAVATSSETIAELMAQRDAWQEKLVALPPEYKTTAASYAKEVERLQGEIQALRSVRGEATVDISNRSGVFEEASRVVFASRIPANLIRLCFFVVFIVLNEMVLYFETYFIAIENGEEESLLDRIRRWKIFHRDDTENRAKDEIRQEVELAIAKIEKAWPPAETLAPSTGEVESLF